MIATSDTHHRRLGCRLEHHDRGERELHPRRASRRILAGSSPRAAPVTITVEQRPAEHHRGVPGERYHAGSNANSILRRRGISRCEPGHDRYLRSRRLIHCKHNANHLGLDRRSSRNSHPTGVVWTVCTFPSSMQSVASYAGGVSGTSASVPVTVDDYASLPGGGC